MHNFYPILFLQGLFVVILACVALPESTAQTWELTQKLHAEDMARNDNLGISTAISDTFMLTGAWWEDADDNGDFINSAGAAYFFKRNQNGEWVETQKVNASAPETLGYFGFNVEIQNGTAFISAPNEQSADGQWGNAGAVYVYEYDGQNWIETQKLQAPDPSHSDNFGDDIAVDGRCLLVGAYLHPFNVVGQDSLKAAGAVYSFYQNSLGEWQQTQKIVPLDRTEDTHFGRNLDISGDQAVIGAFREDNGFNFEAGAAYVFKKIKPGFWIQCQRLLPSKSHSFQQFGYDVAIEGDHILVGAGSDFNAPDGSVVSSIGAVFYYLKNDGGNWEEKQKIFANDYAAGSVFGRAIDIDGEVAVIGSEFHGHDLNGENFLSWAGAAYIFDFNGAQWEQQQKLLGTNRAIQDLFGASVSIDSPYISIGAWQADIPNGGDTLLNAGAVYLFEQSGITSAVRPEINSDLDIAIYPNPGNGFTLDAPGNIFSIDLRIVDSRGVMVEGMRDLRAMHRIDLSHLPSGIYFVHCISPVGSRVVAWTKQD